MTVKIQAGKYYKMNGGGIVLMKHYHRGLVVKANSIPCDDRSYPEHNRPFGDTWLWNTDGTFDAWEHILDYPMHIEREILE